MEEQGHRLRSENRAERAKIDGLNGEDEAIVVAFRKHTLLPLDDCLYSLQATIPHLTRSSLHRCLQRHGISRLPDVEGDKPEKRKFKAYPIGYFHIDIAEVQTAEGKLYLYVAIDRTSKFAFVQLVKKTGRTSASTFLEALIAAVPYKIHTVLTDNGIQFTFPPRYADGPTATYSYCVINFLRREPLATGVAQHGHRERVLTSAMINLLRIVAIELGTWRSVLGGGASGSITFGNGKFFEPSGATRS